MEAPTLVEELDAEVRSSRPLRVVVADDSDRFREGIVRAIGRQDGLAVVAEAADGLSALSAIRRHAPDVALVDARMPALDGISLAGAVAGDPALTGVRVVVLSARSDAELTHAAALAGASGCLDKGLSRREICDAVLALAAEARPR